MSKITPKQYASAIYSLISEKKITDQVIADLRLVLDGIKTSAKFGDYLKHSKDTLDKKQKNLTEVFANNISKESYRAILLLIRDDKLEKLAEIIKELIVLKEKDEGILEAKIDTPLALEETQKDTMKHILEEKTKKTIIINEIINPDLIGGIKINLAGTIIDGSISGQIQRLKQTIGNIG